MGAENRKPVEDMTAEERAAELGPLMNAAFERHVETGESPVPGFFTVRIDTDILLRVNGKTWASLQEGTYLCKLPEQPGKPTGSEHIYTLNIVNSVAELQAMADLPDGLGEPSEDDEPMAYMKIEARPVTNDERDQPLTYAELLLFLAICDIDDDAEAHRVFSLIYSDLPEEAAGDGSDEHARDLPVQDALPIRKQRVPITKAAQLMDSPKFFLPGGTRLKVAGTEEKRRGKTIETAVSFSYDEDDVSLSRPLDAYDIALQGGIATLWEAGIRNFTVQQLTKAIGLSDKSKKALEGVENRLDNQRRIMARIDYTQEARKKKLEVDGVPVASFRLEGHLVEARKADIETANGKVVKGYVFLAQPLLLQHAKALGQVVEYSQRLLDAGRGSNTMENVLVKRLILERIAQLKRKGARISNFMRYSSIHEAAGIDPSDRDRRKKLNDHVLDVLEELKERDAIKGYAERTEPHAGRRKRTGVEITV